MSNRFSFLRLWAIMVKELIQLRRDRLSFAMMIGLPVAQLILFGFAINTDPKHLPMALVAGEESPFLRTLVRGMENSGYFQLVAQPTTRREAEQLMAEGDVQFVVYVPEDFSRKLQRGEQPVVLIEADATDPVATGNALAAVTNLNLNVLNRDLQGSLQSWQGKPPPFELRIHRRYNAEGITQYNIIPGLMGVILTMTMILMTGLAITRERERGTMENLLATPILPIEVIVGKIMPYLAVGYIQVSLILFMARVLFAVPMQGSILLLYVCALPFVAANLSLGILFSTLAKNQLQAMQMTFFFFLPSMLLSGFMFPFRGMPIWAQKVGNLLPLTHFLRLARGILLKGNTVVEIVPHLWPILLFMLLAVFLAVTRYRRTLD